MKKQFATCGDAYRAPSFWHVSQLILVWEHAPRASVRRHVISDDAPTASRVSTQALHGAYARAGAWPPALRVDGVRVFAAPSSDARCALANASAAHDRIARGSKIARVLMTVCALDDRALFAHADFVRGLLGLVLGVPVRHAQCDDQ